MEQINGPNGMAFAWACYPARSVSLFLSRRRSEAAT
jgi:hypothetical protein